LRTMAAISRQIAKMVSVTAVIGPVHDHANRASLCALNGAT
jgi:hypothetical protein